MSNEIQNIVDRILIPHTAMNLAMKRIDQCLRSAYGSAEPICLPLIGESGTGKTRMQEYFVQENPRRRLDDGLRVPIVHVKTPPNPSVKGLAEALLRSLGDPRPDKGTETNMTSRLITLIKAAETRMLMLDEFQHFYDRKSHKVMHHVADWLKVMVDDSRVALVVSGLPSCQAVLNQNEQLARRFLAPIRMPRFDWKNEELRAEFIAILGAFREGLAEFDMPDLDSDEMAFRFFCASGGLIGYVAKILRQAVWDAVDAGKRIITLEDLARAYRDAVYSDEQASNLLPAFDRGFVVQVTEELMQRVRAIGTALPEEVSPRRRRSKSENLTTAQVLRT